MSPVSKNLALLIVAIVLTLLLGEAIARVIYSRPWPVRLLEEQNDPELRAAIRRNSRGLRGPEYPGGKPPHAHRVLILGDSFTFGSGVEDDEAVFPRLLERQLNIEFAARGEIIQIFNGGIEGSLTGQWVDLLRELEDSFQPDVILVVFFLRDGTQTDSMGSFFGPVRDEIEARNAGDLWYKLSYLKRLYQDYLDRRYLAEKYSIVLNEAYFGDDEQTREWENARNNILIIKSIAEKRKAGLGLVIFPILVELNERYPFQEICAAVSNFTTVNNIPTHNLLPAFLGRKGADLWVSGYNQHPNPTAHRLAADSIRPFLQELIEQ